MNEEAQKVFPEHTDEWKRLSLEMLHRSLEEITKELVDLNQLKLFESLIEPLEKTVIKAVVDKCGGNYLHASKILGIARATLRKKLGVKHSWGKKMEKTDD